MRRRKILYTVILLGDNNSFIKNLYIPCYDKKECKEAVELCIECTNNEENIQKYKIDMVLRADGYNVLLRR